jgi:hypothetical protein
MESEPEVELFLIDRPDPGLLAGLNGCGCAEAPRQRGLAEPGAFIGPNHVPKYRNGGLRTMTAPRTANFADSFLLGESNKKEPCSVFAWFEITGFSHE